MRTITPTFFGYALVVAGLFSGVGTAFAQLDDVCPRPDDIVPIPASKPTAEQVGNGEAIPTEFAINYLAYAYQIS